MGRPHLLQAQGNVRGGEPTHVSALACIVLMHGAGTCTCTCVCYEGTCALDRENPASREERYVAVVWRLHGCERGCILHLRGFGLSFHIIKTKDLHVRCAATLNGSNKIAPVRELDIHVADERHDCGQPPLTLWLGSKPRIYIATFMCMNRERSSINEATVVCISVPKNI